IDDNREALAKVGEEYGGLDEASTRTLEGILSNFELQRETLGDASVDIEEWASTFKDALDAAEKKSGVTFDQLDKGAKSAADSSAELAANAAMATENMVGANVEAEKLNTLLTAGRDLAREMASAL
ncbi:MAG: hypothetical protein OEM67_11900, partial [Thermoleophilia bacterium]|nr:hypothetical protein [Thermoleophilia bacterium]